MAFARAGVVPRAPAAAFFVLVLLWLATQPGRWVTMARHLAMFFAAALACHAELVRRRPPSAHLTSFYLWIAVGGAVGGVFNALLAPQLFTALVEYPAMLVLACWLAPRPLRGDEPRWNWRDMRIPIALAVAFVVLFLALPGGSAPWKSALGAGFCVCVIPWPRRFGLAVGALLLAQAAGREHTSETLYSARNYYGTVRVLRNPRNEVHWLVHGNVEHGAQRFAPEARIRRLPLLYFDLTGPIGQFLGTNLKAGNTSPIAVVGLGAGALASYGETGQEMVFSRSIRRS